MINKINAATPNTIGFKQSQITQYPAPKTKFNNFKDNFIQSSKNMLPSSVVIAAFWSFIDSRKNKKIFGKALANNLATFVAMSLIVSGVDALIRSNSKNQNY